MSIYQAATQSTLGPFDYDYDADGNLTTQPGAGATREMTYDSQSRLVQVQAGGQSASHQYDLDGRRIATVAGGQTTIYFGDLFEYAPDPNPAAPDETKGTSFVFAFGERFVSRRVTAPTLRTAAASPFGIPLPEVPPWVFPVLLLGGAGWLAVRLQVPRALRARPAYGTLSLVLCVSLVALPAGGGGDPSSIVTRWYLSDPLGSTSLVLAVDGEVSRRQLDPYGEVAAETSSEPTHRLFTGQRVDPTTGLADFRARWYDPTAARFLSADPLIADAFDPQQHNAFAFVRGNPLRYTDPTGAAAEAGLCANPALCVVFIGITILNLFGDAEAEVEEEPLILGPAGPPGAGLEISINLDLPATSFEDMHGSPQSPDSQRSTSGEERYSAADPEVPRDGHDFISGLEMYALLSGTWGILRGGATWATRTLRAWRLGGGERGARTAAQAARALTASETGEVVGWGVGQSAQAVAQTRELTRRLTTEMVQEMAERGLTKERVIQLLEKYRNAIEEGGKKLKNKQLRPREELMERILELWPD